MSDIVALAVINAGVVENVIMAPADWPAPAGMTIMPANGAGIGWTLNGSTLVAPVVAVPTPTAADLVAYAEDKQVALRDGGITVNVGTSAAPQVVDVASDVNGRSLVSGCVQLSGLASANNQPAPTFPWINNDGSAETLTGAQMMTVGYALGAFVQSGYQILGVILAAIADGTITTTAGVDAASWPSTAC